MARMEAVENIYDVLDKAGLRTDHYCFDEILMACLSAAVDPLCKGKELVTIVYEAQDEDDEGFRTEEEICMDWCDYRRISHAEAFMSDILAQAVAAGVEGWRK